MNWEAVSASAETIGSAGVIITLIYLVIQIRANTNAMVRTEARDVQTNCMTAFYAVANDKDLSEIIVRGTKAMSDLDEVERYRFDLAVAGYLLPVEQALAASRSNLYLQDDLAPLKTIVKGILDSPGCKQWWNERRDWFTPRFVAMIDEMLADQAIEGSFLSKGSPPNA